MPARSISSELIKDMVIDTLGGVWCTPDPHTLDLIGAAMTREENEIARDMLSSILENARIAKNEQVPACQDTGLVIIFAELGVDVHIDGGTLTSILDQAVLDAWTKYYLRDSVSPDPLRLSSVEVKPDISSPVILHLEQVPGHNLTLHLCLKGGGAENCSALKMFHPTASAADIEGFIVDTVVSAGGKPCPPVIVGVGIGGDFEKCALLAKKALVVPSTPKEQDAYYRQMEVRLLQRINNEGKGVQGFAGQTTALEVRISTAPCHIASLPVAVNIECHSHRCASITI
jgi:fumarate hydratase subunit alpha